LGLLGLSNFRREVGNFVSRTNSSLEISAQIQHQVFIQRLGDRGNIESVFVSSLLANLSTESKLAARAAATVTFGANARKSVRTARDARHTGALCVKTIGNVAGSRGQIEAPFR